MSTRLEVAATTTADLDRSWEVLVDWAGQARWIPQTTVRVVGGSGLGARLEALSGLWLGPVPVGLLDRFVVTGWSPPRDGAAELEVLHLGPYFTGEGVFHLRDLGGRTEVSATEVFTVPGGPPTNAPVRLLLPLMRAGFGFSLRRFAAVAEGRRGVSVLPGPDGQLRCSWALGTAEYVDYHDLEWGRPVRTVAGLYERMTLEAFQSGLAWITILRKREGFRAAFAGFDPERVAAFDADDVARLMADAGIVRNRAKIEAAISNARVVAELGPVYAELIWSYATPDRPRPTVDDVRATTPESVAMAKALKRAGIRFFGPTTAYALMQACGLVDDHLVDCFVPPVSGR